MNQFAETEVFGGSFNKENMITSEGGQYKGMLTSFNRNMRVGPTIGPKGAKSPSQKVVISEPIQLKALADDDDIEQMVTVTVDQSIIQRSPLAARGSSRREADNSPVNGNNVGQMATVPQETSLC